MKKRPKIFLRMLYLMQKKSYRILIIQDYFPSGLTCKNGAYTIFTRDIWRVKTFTLFRTALPFK